MTLLEAKKSFSSNTLKGEEISNYVCGFLKKLGLTENELKVYLYLNKNGTKKAKEIAQNQKIPRTQTYHLLTALQNKGIVVVISGRITKFEGIEFEKMLDILINNEQKRIEALQLMRNQLNKLRETDF